MIAAVILPGDLPLAEAARRVTRERPYLVITRDGAFVCTPVLLPGMQRIAVRVDADDEREAA